MDQKEKAVYFFEAERKNKLFGYTTKDGFPIWDIIRYYVWLDFSLQNSNASTEGKKNILNIYSHLVFFFKSIISFLYLLFMKKEWLYFGASRFLDSSTNRYIDPYFEGTKSLLKNNCIFFESVPLKPRYSVDKRVFNPLPYLKWLHFKIGKRQMTLINSTEVNAIYRIIEEEFPATKITIDDIYNHLLSFFVEYRFYSWLFKVKKTEKVFLHQNGIQKALILAARRLNAIVYEFQHGDIADTTIVYNYGPSQNDFANIIYPNYLLTFSNLWVSGKNIPSRCVEIGTTFFNTKKIVSTDDNSLVIIASREHNTILEALAIEIAEYNSHRTIYYKLHPAQFHLAELQKSYFYKYPNIRVISSELNIRDLFHYSNRFIAIYSTAIFEAVQAGKYIYIYQRANYLNFKQYFSLTGVHLFDDYRELDAHLNVRFSLSKDSSSDFFKPFNKEQFELLLGKGQLSAK